jgi:hypothetical protein
MASAGSMLAALAAAGATVVAVLGLLETVSVTMLPVGTIVLGAAILFHAAAVGMRYQRLLHEAAAHEAALTARPVHFEVRAGTSAESLAGVAGIALGVLALLGVAPGLLCSVALIVFGAGLLLSGAENSRLRSLGIDHQGVSEATGRLIDAAASFSIGSDALVAVAAITLGILALLGFATTTLVFVGILSMGFALLLSSSSLGARAVGVLRHPA